MAQRESKVAGGSAEDHAAVFAALGDVTRLGLLRRLCGGEALSIRELAAGTTMTRQAVRKHLRVLERVGMVRGIRVGRDSLLEYDPGAVEAAREYLEEISGDGGRVRDQKASDE